MSDMSETEDVNLIVENGTCVTGANSYISLTDADTYMKNAGHSAWSALDENTRKSCLINGTLYIDHIYSKYGTPQHQTQNTDTPGVSRAQTQKTQKGKT